MKPASLEVRPIDTKKTFANVAMHPIPDINKKLITLQGRVMVSILAQELFLRCVFVPSVSIAAVDEEIY